MLDRSLAPSAAGVPGASGGLGQRWRHLDKTLWVWLVAIVVLVFLVVNPLLRLFIASFQDDGGAFTAANYVAAYNRLRYL
jgi:iron(III) transport system permease protein